MNEGTDIPHFREGTFVQYVADNVDHNIRTLDGHNTFHGMAMIEESRLLYLERVEFHASPSQQKISLQSGK